MAKSACRIRATAISRLARWLGFAGLAPQVLIAALAVGGPPQIAAIATGLGLSYATLILSFIGGAWWGLAARAGKRAPSWLWLAAIIPSLVAFTALGTALIGRVAGPSLLATGAALIAALGIDSRLAQRGLCPPGWLRLRTPLSLGLGALCMIIASLAP